MRSAAVSGAQIEGGHGMKSAAVSGAQIEEGHGLSGYLLKNGLWHFRVVCRQRIFKKVGVEEGLQGGERENVKLQGKREKGPDKTAPTGAAKAATSSAESLFRARYVSKRPSISSAWV